jgi:hypothetical protein
MREASRSTQILLTTEDETSFSEALVASIPNLRFLDGQRWKIQPRVVPSIQECSTNLCYLYDGALEDLPTLARADGQLQGPTSGCVIQICRPISQGDVLRSGSISTGYFTSDERMVRLVKATWKVLKAIGTMGVVRPDNQIDRHYLVGHFAKRQSLEGSLRLRDRSVEIFYAPLVK